MSSRVLALYRSVRLVLVAFVVAAAWQGLWGLALGGLVARTALWWIALPHRRLKSGGTFGETWARKMVELRREQELSRFALMIAKTPTWANLVPRLILMAPSVWLLRDPVANALIRHGRKAGPKLLSLTRSSEPDVRASAARALRELRPDGTDEALRTLRNDPYDEVRAASSKPGAPQAVPTSDPLLRLMALSGEEAVPEELVEALRRTFDAMGPGEKEDVLRRLGELPGEPALRWLLELGESDAEVGTMARKALLKIDDPRVTDLFVGYAERKPDSFLGLTQLQKRNDPRVEALLIRRLDSDRRTTRVLALSLLGRIPTDTARVALRARLRDERGWVRLCAAESLALNAGEPEALQRYARSWNPIYRGLARKTLKKAACRERERVDSA